ncbi:MAG: septum formation family protein [Acidimicrobiia bacterium]|jgi:hypothetical protein
MRRAVRPALLAAAFLVLASGCTAGESGTTTTTSEPAPTSSEAAPTTTTTDAADRVEPPVLADPFDLAEEALADIEGWRQTSAPDTPPQLTRLEMALDAYAVSEAIVWDRVADTAGDEVFVASIYPYGFARGDPTLPPFAARLLSQYDEEPEAIPIDHGVAYATAWPDGEWMVWGSNTVLIVAAGPRGAALEVLTALAAANQDEYRWQPGDCLWFGGGDALDIAPFAPYGRGPVVPCDGWHTHEVIGASLVEDGPDAPYPGDSLPTEAYRDCEERFLDVIGIPVRESRVETVWYYPDDLEWEEGDRYLACVVMEPDAAGEAAPRRATLAGIGDASRRVLHPGECWNGSLAGDPVPCDRTHDSEYLGSVEMEAGSDEPYSESLVVTLADTACRALLAGAADPPDGVTLDVFGEPPGPLAWADGDRTADCRAVAVDDGVPQLVIGSVTEEGWRVVAPVGDDAVTA